MVLKVFEGIAGYWGVVQDTAWYFGVLWGTQGTAWYCRILLWGTGDTNRCCGGGGYDKYRGLPWETAGCWSLLLGILQYAQLFSTLQCPAGQNSTEWTAGHKRVHRRQVTGYQVAFSKIVVNDFYSI